MNTATKSYPPDVSDEEWSLIPPHLLLMKKYTNQLHYDLKDLFNGLLYAIRCGIV